MIDPSQQAQRPRFVKVNATLSQCHTNTHCFAMKILKAIVKKVSITFDKEKPKRVKASQAQIWPDLQMVARMAKMKVQRSP